jgi:hypothetical protein
MVNSIRQVRPGGTHQRRVLQRELLGAVQDVVHALHADKAAVVLVCHLVLVGPEATATPDILLLQVGQCLLQHPVSLQRRGGVPVLQAAVVDGHDLVGGLDHLRVDGALDGFL